MPALHNLAMSRFARATTVGLFAAGLVVGPPLAGPALGEGSWSDTDSLAEGRWGHSQTVLDGPACREADPPSYCGRVLVAGGHIGASATQTSEVFDPGTQEWSSTGTMQAGARAGHSATLLDGGACDLASPPVHCGRVLVAGGGPTGEGATAELYDPATGEWSTTGTLNTPRSDHEAVLLDDGRVLVVGGTSEPRAEIYDPAGGTWSDTGALTTERLFGHTASPLRDGTVLVVGGRRFDSNFGRFVTLNSAERYDPATGSFEPAGAMVVQRFDHRATPLADGTLLITGGKDADGHARISAEIFEPDTSSWSFPDSMGTARSNHVAVPLPDGTVLVAGGESPDVDTAELFDPASGSWAYTGSLNTERRAHAGTLLAGVGCEPVCGRVLVSGGVRMTPGQRISSAELYDRFAATAPGRVTDLAAEAHSGYVIDFTFAAPGSNGKAPPPAEDYVVKQARSPITQASFDDAKSLCGGICSFSPGLVGRELMLRVKKLTPEQRYHFAVRARDADGNLGPMSNVVAARTLDVEPGRVRDLKARPLSARSVVLRFSAPGSNGAKPPPARSYIVKQSRKPIRNRGDFKGARTLCKKICRFSPGKVGARLTLKVTGLRPGSTYFYALRARDQARNVGARSNTARVAIKRG